MEGPRDHREVVRPSQRGHPVDKFAQVQNFLGGNFGENGIWISMMEFEYEVNLVGRQFG
jgi:hypothetical protein